MSFRIDAGIRSGESVAALGSMATLRSYDEAESAHRTLFTTKEQG